MSHISQLQDFLSRIETLFLAFVELFSLGSVHSAQLPYYKKYIYICYTIGSHTPPLPIFSSGRLLYVNFLCVLSEDTRRVNC